MPTALDRAVDSLSDPSIATADALRRLLVVSRRIGSVPLTEWINSELNGFDRDQPAPAYRDGRLLPISLRFDGMYGTHTTRTVATSDLPDELGAVTRELYFRQPVAELEALTAAAREGDYDGPQMNLPLAWLVRYRQLAEEGLVPHMEMMILNRAFVAMPRTRLRGMVDRIRSTALDLALDMEDTSGDVGDTGGPTVITDAGLATAVGTHLVQIFATHSAVSVASGAGSMAQQINVGDIEGLLGASRTILDVAGAEELSRAIEHDGRKAGAETKNFLSRLRAGAVGLAGGVSTNGAYDGLLALLKACFPDFN